MWELLKFLWDNRDVLDAVKRAYDAGLTKDDLVKSIDKTIIEASDIVVEHELGEP